MMARHFEPCEAWHFVGDRLYNGRPVPPDGTTLYYYGALGRWGPGLHAARLALDALMLARGRICCRVWCAGEMIEESDRLYCRERTILWRVDASGVLSQFARWCALDVVHTWNAPGVVRGYLATGDETLLAAAEEAMWEAEEKGEWSVAAEIARTAAWRALPEITRGPAWNAARGAAWNAVRGVAGNTKGSTAWIATWKRYSAKLEELLERTRAARAAQEAAMEAQGLASCDDG